MMLEPKAKRGRRTLLRVLGAVLLIAVLYIGFQQTWVAAAGYWIEQLPASVCKLARDTEGREAERVAQRSAQRERELTPQHRVLILQLGYLLGSNAQMLGSVSTSNPTTQAQMRQVVASNVQRAQQLGQALGLAPITEIPSSTAADFLRLTEKIETDANGMAARIEAATTLRHRHLYLLGAYLGTVSAQLYMSALQGAVQPVSQPKIARHATLAGIPCELWVPLLQIPSGSGLQPVEQYEARLTKLRQSLNQADVGGRVSK